MTEKELDIPGFRCRYGLNSEFWSVLVGGPLRAYADDATGEVRAVELDGHQLARHDQLRYANEK